MIDRWRSYYRLGTGEILPFRDKLVEPMPALPEGIGAIEGAYDHLSQRVDIETGEVVDWQPDKPEGDEYTDHEWDAGTKRWVPVLTLAGRKRDAWESVKRLREERLDAPAVADGIAYRITKDEGNLKSILTTRLAVGVPTAATITWTDDANVDRALDGDQLAALALAMLTRGEAIYERARALRSAIADAADADALSSIDLEAGWP